MKIEIVKTNDDGTVVVKAETITKVENDYGALETKSTEQFNNGFGKGSEAGKKEAVKDVTGKLSFLNLDANDLDGSISKAKTDIETLKKGGGKGSEAMELLQKQLTEKSTAFDTLQKDYNGFKTAQLIDGTLKNLAVASGAVNVDQVPLIFKNDYKVELDENNNIVVKNPKNDQPIFDATSGDPKGLKTIFENDFLKTNPHLFKAKGPGGGGGGDEKTDFSHIKTFKDFKTDAEKVAFIKENGQAEYQKLMEQHTVLN